MNTNAILALDAGTTSVKALLVEAETGKPVVAASRSVAISFPRAGWVEQDANQMWTATLEAASECLRSRPDQTVVGVSISNQRESVVCWSRRTGEPLGPVLGWQDSRTADWCANLLAEHPSAADLVAHRTGLSLDPMFSAPKLRRALEDALQSGVPPSEIALGTVDSWLIWRLTGEHVTEVGNASRTLLLDLHSLEAHSLKWDDELLNLFGIPSSTLPQVRASDAGFGGLRDEVASDLGLPANTPVVAVLADSHAALFYHQYLSPGAAKATYGTGTSVMSLVPQPGGQPTGIATSVAWVADGKVCFAREGNIAASGAALDWMATTLGVPRGESGGAFLSSLAAEVSDSGGVCFVPAFAGLSAPFWDRQAVGIVTGVTAGTTRAHLARAALESVAHQVADVVEAMESDGAINLSILKADGGASGSSLLMQLQADLLNRPVEVADFAGASAVGAAVLALRTLGLGDLVAGPGRVVEPSGVDSGPLRRQWSSAVRRSRGQPPVAHPPVAAPSTDP